MLYEVITSVNEQKYEELCKHSSEMESKAANAERTSVKYKQVEFMQDQIGKVYPGTISGVTDWGVITSYSIHYTKLYETPSTARQRK